MNIHNTKNGLYYQAILVYLVPATGGAGIAPISNVCMDATFQTSLVEDGECNERQPLVGLYSQ